MAAALVGLGSAALGSAASIAIGGTWGAIAGTVVATGIGYAGNKLTGLGQLPRSLDLGGTMVTRCATDAAIPVVYGTRRVAPLIVYKGTTDRIIYFAGERITTRWNGYLHIIGVLCEGELAETPTAADVFIGKDALDGGKFDGLYRLNVHTGADDQAADDDAVAEIGGWTYAHTLSGCAYFYLRLQYDSDVFSGGLEDITVEVTGRKVYDTRDTTWKQSNNPALCIRDYLLNTRFGYAAKHPVAESEIDDDTFEAAANYCETEAYGLAWDLFTLDGVVDTAQEPESNLDAMLTCCRGSIVRSNGKYKLLIDKAETPTGFDFNEDNIKGSWTISLGGRERMLNRVRAEYFSNSPYETTPGVRYQLVDSSTYRALDNLLMLRADIQLPFTTYAWRAQVLAALVLLASRQPIRCEFTALPVGARVEKGDVVTVTHATPGWSGKEFRVDSISPLGDGEVRVGLVEYDEDAYDYEGLLTGSPDDEDDPDTDLFDPTAIGAPGAPTVVESTYETREGRGVAAKATLSWEPSSTGYVLHYVAEYKLAADSDYTVIGVTPATSIEVLDIVPGTYNFRVKAVSTLGAVSEYSGTTTQAISGLLAPPATIANLRAQASAGVLILTWDAIADLDVLIGGTVRVRHDPATSGATWDTGTDVLSVPGRSSQAIVPLVAGTYMAKAVDSSGIESAAIASVYSSGPFPWTLTEVDSIQEDSSFSGSKTNCEVNGSSLRLTIDGNGDVAASGTYTFNDSYSGAAVAVHRVIVTMDAAVTNEQDNIDSRTADMDDWPIFDGAAIPAAAADAKVYCRWKDASGDSYGSWQIVNGAGDFSGRYAEFKCELVSSDPAYNIYLSQLRVKVYTYA